MKSRASMVVVLLAVIIVGLVWRVTTPPIDKQALVANIRSNTTPPNKATPSQSSNQGGIAFPVLPPAIISSTNNNASALGDTQKNASTSSPRFRYVLGPADGLMKVEAALGMASAQARIPNPADLKIKPPIAVYELSAAELAQGATLDAAHLVRFHYLVEASGKSTMYAEVYGDPSANGGHAMTGFGGPNQGAIASALEELSSSEQTRGGAYEVRILRLSSVLNSTWADVVWLKSDDSGPDFLYLLPPYRLSPEAKKFYSGVEFLKLIFQVVLEKQQAAPPARMDGRVLPT